MVKFILDIINKLLPVMYGWILSSKITENRQLKETLDKKEKYDEINSKYVSTNDAYDGLLSKE